MMGFVSRQEENQEWVLSSHSSPYLRCAFFQSQLSQPQARVSTGTLCAKTVILCGSELCSLTQILCDAQVLDWELLNCQTYLQWPSFWEHLAYPNASKELSYAIIFPYPGQNPICSNTDTAEMTCPNRGGIWTFVRYLVWVPVNGQIIWITQEWFETETIHCLRIFFVQQRQ